MQFLRRLKPMTSETFGDAHPVVAGVVSPSTASSMNWHSFLGEIRRTFCRAFKFL